jgi:hypothetical protein
MPVPLAAISDAVTALKIVYQNTPNNSAAMIA